VAKFLDEVFQGFEGFWLGLGDQITFFSQAITYMPLKQVIGMMLLCQTGVRVSVAGNRSST
jgi:hypothetical protein